LKPPSGVTTFRYKASVKRSKKTRTAAKAAGPEQKPQQQATKPNPKEIRLQKRLETARKKLDAAKAAGAPVKNFEDKVYEIEDELRLTRGQ
jgi:hypothetical protein